jgi:hypothetical protein
MKQKQWIVCLVQGWRSCGMRAQNGTPKVFLYTRQALLSHVLVLLLDQPVYIVNNTACIQTHISDCVEVVNEIPLLANNMACETFLHKHRECGCWLDIYYWGASLAVTGGIRAIGQNFYCLLFKQEVVVADVVTPTLSSLWHCTWRKYSNNKTLFCSYCSHGQAKGFLRNL